ncbi:MAG: hypothetical protein M3Y87_02375 [Myxococcota bacterium]|nr:hypothetical protein [Myxococcota bacterium]
MSIRVTTTAAERIDVLLQHARKFYELDQVGEAIARTRHALSQCDKELRGAADEGTAREIQTRRAYALWMLERLGGKPFPSNQHATI